MFKTAAAGLKRFVTGYLLAILIGLAAFAVVVITTRMNQMAGIAQAATEEGQFLFGWANIAVQVVGVVLCGIIAGIAAKHHYKKITRVMAVIVAFSALCSALAIMGFLEIETLSVTRSREAQIEQHAKDAEARRQASGKRLELQAKLAEKQMQINSGLMTTGKTIGRKERGEIRKDAAAASRALISDIGKEQAAPSRETTAEPVLIAPVSGSEMISKLTFGLVSVEGAANFRLGLMTIILLVLEVVLWPTAGYAWGGFGVSAVAPAAIPAPTAPTTAEPIKLEEIRLALPKQPQPPKIAVEPSPEWRALLEAIEYPRKKGLREPERPQDKREVIGWRWLVWLAANGHAGEFTASQVEKLYDAFCDGDYPKIRWGMNVAKGELHSAGKKWITVRAKPTTWMIQQPSLQRVRDQLVKRKIIAEPVAAAKIIVEAPAPEAGGERTGGPFGSGASTASAAAPAADNENVAARKPVNGLAELQRFLVEELRGRVNWPIAGEHSLWAQAREARMHKILERQRFPNRKQLNRMSRARAA